MKLLSTATALSSTTQFTSATAVWLSNTTSGALTVTLRNADDDADVGSISVPANFGVVVNFEPGQGLRGSSSILATQVNAAAGY